jgi:hypothetical protein
VRIARLQDARDALIGAEASPADHLAIAPPSTNHQQPLGARTPSRAAVVALARELDAGLRTRV